MNYQEDPIVPGGRKALKLETEEGAVSGKPTYTQKFCENWLYVFTPWLSRCKDDPEKPFCRACQCCLHSNRCHLLRHERTSKHIRLLQILVNHGEDAVKQNRSIRQERIKYYQQQRKEEFSTGSVDSQADTEIGTIIYNKEVEQQKQYGYEQSVIASEEQYNANVSITEFKTIVPVDQLSDKNVEMPKNSDGQMQEAVSQEESRNALEEDSATDSAEEVTSTNSAEEDILPVEEDAGIKLFMQIQQDKKELMALAKELSDSIITENSTSIKKSPVDLFFESVSSSVKAFPPKLIAEAKMRISRLICELELRMLVEEDIVHNPEQE